VLALGPVALALAIRCSEPCPGGDRLVSPVRSRSGLPGPVRDGSWMVGASRKPCEGEWPNVGRDCDCDDESPDCARVTSDRAMGMESFKGGESISISGVFCWCPGRGDDLGRRGVSPEDEGVGGTT